MRGLEGKVALCTGAGREGGLGHGILTRLGLAGCRLIVTDESLMTPDNALVTDLKQAGYDVIGISCDVASENQ